MTIEIKTEKVFTTDKRRAYKIIGIKALNITQLPQEYIMSDGCVFFKVQENCFIVKRESQFIFESSQYFYIGDILLASQMKQILSVIKKAGTNLQQINSKLAKKEKNKQQKTKKRTWQGEQTFKI